MKIRDNVLLVTVHALFRHSRVGGNPKNTAQADAIALPQRGCKSLAVGERSEPTVREPQNPESPNGATELNRAPAGRRNDAARFLRPAGAYGFFGVVYRGFAEYRSPTAKFLSPRWGFGFDANVCKRFDNIFALDSCLRRNDETNRERLLLLYVGGFLLCAAIVGVYVASRSPQESAEKIDALKIVPYLQDGDILCRLGDRFWSDYFMDLSLTDKRFSHLGIVRIQEGSISVIHAEAWRGDGKDCVKEVPLEEFIQATRAIGLYRANSIDGTVLSNGAVEYKGRPFDWGFDMRDDAEIYCTELLYVILKHIAPEIILQTVYFKGIDKEIVPLEAITKSNDFEEVLCVTR